MSVWSLRLLTALLGLLLGAQAGAGEVPVPKPMPGLGSYCVEDTAFMRRNHMDLLRHQRDDTMYNGLRTERHSLKNCINCHMAEEVVGKERIEITDSRHFCAGCHQYASVKPDCFECHSSQPEPGVVAHPVARK